MTERKLEFQGCRVRVIGAGRDHARSARGTIFLLERVDGMSYPEIAERLWISLRTVNRNMAEASDYPCRHLDRQE